MKILVISCGGTICCKKENGIIRPGENAFALLIENTKCRAADFSFLDCGDIPSENSNGLRISHIVNTVLGNTGGFDGVILLHGTDTLQYTAAALSYACGASCAPVLVVSADYVLKDSRTNGYENFACAVQFIAKNGGRGVFVPYKNSGAAPAVHRASRLLCHMDYSAALFSLAGQVYGRFQNGVFKKNDGYRALEDEAPPFGRLSLCEYSDKLFVLHARPGLQYPEIPEGVQAVLVRAYHSGTLPHKDKSFLRFAAALRERQILCFLSGGGGSVYESAEKFGEAGIMPLPAMAFPAQVMKLWLTLAAGRNAAEAMPLSIGEDKIPNF